MACVYCMTIRRPGDECPTSRHPGGTTAAVYVYNEARVIMANLLSRLQDPVPWSPAQRAVLRELSLKWHPDRCDRFGHSAAIATEVMQLLNQFKEDAEAEAAASAAEPPRTQASSRSGESSMPFCPDCPCRHHGSLPHKPRNKVRAREPKYWFFKAAEDSCLPCVKWCIQHCHMYHLEESDNNQFTALDWAKWAKPSANRMVVINYLEGLRSQTGTQLGEDVVN